MRPFSLYVHIPYCQAKCPYCDFNSHAATTWPEQRYVDALCAELRQHAQSPVWHGRSVATVFFGGGTPSLFAARSLAEVLETIAGLWGLSASAEVTVEANPGTLSPNKLAELRAAGIDRVSFGVQSFQPRHLAALGRIHSGEQARAAIGDARRAGFQRVSLDMMYALHDQTLDEWRTDLATAIALEPDHLSAYNLTYEEGTAYHEWLAQGRLARLDEEVEIAMFDHAREQLNAAGFRHYEISNYARPGEECRHNLNYWRAGDYLAVGAGAHSYHRELAPSPARDGQRWANLRAPQAYLTAIERDGTALAQQESLDRDRAMGEFVFLNLRCLAGFDGSEFVRRFGAALHTVFPHAEELQRGGLLERDGEQWRLSGRGLLLADSVFASFA